MYREGSFNDRLGELVEARRQLVDAWISVLWVSRSFFYNFDHLYRRAADTFRSRPKLVVVWPCSCRSGGGGRVRGATQGCLAVHGELEGLRQCGALLDGDMAANRGVAHVIDGLVYGAPLTSFPERPRGAMRGGSRGPPVAASRAAAFFSCVDLGHRGKPSSSA